MSEFTTTTQRPILAPKEARQLIDDYLTEILDARTASATEIDPAYGELWGNLRRLFTSGGKRFRPYMTMLVFQAYSDQPVADILPAAAALEFLHLGTLIHDDIIDRDTVRYGVRNISGEYRSMHKTLLPDKANRDHFADSAALLAGDLLLAETHHLVADANIPPHIAHEVRAHIHQAFFRVIGGELLDTEASFKKLAGAHPKIIAEYKTASYSFVAPFMVGASLASAPDTQREKLAELARILGVGYQIRDDMMGLFGDESVTGKSADGDIKEGKRTIISDEFLRRADAAQKARFEKLYGRQNLTDEEVEEVRSLLRNSGTTTVIEHIIADHESDARDIIASLDVHDDSRAALQKLVTICLQREA